MLKQIDTPNYIIYFSDSLTYYINDLEQILNERIVFYNKLFDINSFRKVQINMFDNLDNFREYIYSLRGEKESLPTYAKGTFDKDMINIYIKPGIIIGTPLYYLELYSVTHELFHIMYKELIWSKKYNRILWFDEGMAQLFSGEFNIIQSNFNCWFKNIINNTTTIPNLNKITFNNLNYDLCILAVKYLYDTLEIEELKKLMYTPNKIIEYGNNIVENALKYYNHQINNGQLKKIILK